MGYTLELRAVSLDTLAEHVRTPTVSADEILTGIRSRSHDLEPDPEFARLVDRWADVAAGVAARVAAGGGVLDWPESAYLVHLVQHLGHWYGASGHSSSGGDEFRAEFETGIVADVFGSDVGRSLLSRPFLGLITDDHPFIGHLTTSEVRTATAHAVTRQDRLDAAGDDEGDELDIWSLLDTLQRAADTGQDIATIYA